MTSVLNLHAGGDLVTKEELALIPAPAPTETWFPIPHHEVLASVESQLQSAGYLIKEEALAVSHEGQRFFGTLDLGSEIVDGISLAVGIRNSSDKTFPIGFCCGQRTFICSNLAFTSEVVVSKRHTRFGNERYLEGLSQAVASLGQYKQTAAEWIGRLQATLLPKERQNSIILTAYERGMIGARQLPELIAEVRSPSYEAFKDESAYSLWNCFTTVIGRTKRPNPAKAATTTIRLQGLFSEAL